MSTPSISPEPVKKEFRKRLFIKAAGFGAGFALVFALSAGVGTWYIKHSKHIKPWNNQVLKAEFRSIGKTDSDTFAFQYVVENTSDNDYTLRSMAGVNLGVSSVGYVAMCNDCASLTLIPLFIPAHKKVLMPVQLNSAIPLELKTELSRGKQEDEDNIVLNYIKTHYQRFGGFVLYDENTRYEIDFPPAWSASK